MALVRRDPFAREELHRERVSEPELGGQTCPWCGQRKYTPKAGRPYLYRYWLETDGGRDMDIRGLFCSEDCRKAYQW